MTWLSSVNGRHKSNVLTTDSCCWRCRSRAMAFVEIPIASSNNSLVCQYNPPLAFHRFPFTHARNRWENCMSHSQWSVTQNSNVRVTQRLNMQHLTPKKEECNTKFFIKYVPIEHRNCNNKHHTFYLKWKLCLMHLAQEGLGAIPPLRVSKYNV